MKIFLIGMMGSGKSYWANMMAQQLNIPAFDLDKLVEEKEGRSIEEMFAQSGEVHFRKTESEVLHQFTDKTDFILATGGGTPCYFDNMQWMNAQGLTIWLNESIPTLVKRLIPEKNHRPLIAKLEDDALALFLEEKLEQRKSFYGLAKYIIEENNINDSTLLSIIKQNTHA